MLHTLSAFPNPQVLADRSPGRYDNGRTPVRGGISLFLNFNGFDCETGGQGLNTPYFAKNAHFLLPSRTQQKKPHAPSSDTELLLGHLQAVPGRLSSAPL